MPDPRPGQERFIAPVEETPLQAVDAVDLDRVPEGQWKEAWNRLRKDPVFWLSAVMLTVVAVVIAVPGLFTDADPTYASLSKSFEPASSGHPFGYNQQGADVWARTVYGTRASVAVGVVCTIFVAIIGIITGALAGWYGGWVDTIISRASDVFLSIPYMMAAIVAISTINNVWPDRGFFGGVIVLVLAIGAFAWPSTTRQMRGAVLSVKNLEFVDAARAIGAGRMRNMIRHAVPNSLAPVIVSSMISLGTIIVAEATLSFLGLGFPSNVVSWGNDLSDATIQVRAGSHLTVMWVPATALAFTVLAFVLLGEAVREALDPKARRS